MKVTLCLNLLLLFAMPALAQSEQYATVHVYRYKESGLYLKTKTMIYCDGAKMARIGNARVFTAKIAPGLHIFTARDKDEAGIEVELKSGETYYINAQFDMTTIRLFRKPNFRLMLVNPEQAVTEVRRLEPIASDDVLNRSVVVSPREQATAQSETKPSQPEKRKKKKEKPWYEMNDPR